MTDITSESIPNSSSVPISEKLPEINDITSPAPIESEEPEDNATQNDQLNTGKTEQEDETPGKEEEKDTNQKEKLKEQKAQTEPTLETEQQHELDEGEGDGAENETINTIEQHNEVEHTQNGNSLHLSPSKLNRRTSISSAVTDTVSMQFLKSSFTNIVSVKEVPKKHPELLKASNSILETLKKNDLPEDTAIFEALRLACEQSNIDVKIYALDCLSKIFTFNLFSEETHVTFEKKKPEITSEADMDTLPNINKESEISLIDASIQTITECFEGEGTDERIELQVIRVLTAAILNENLPVHGKVLLQAVRQIYNIFLLSLSASNQGIAQATLTQIVNVVFEKVKDIKDRFSKGQSSISVLNNNHDTRSIDSSVTTPATPVKMSLKTMQNMSTDEDINYMAYPHGDDDETNIRDAFLIFRSMSNLAVKPIDAENVDMRSHAARSKLLSLYIVHSILKSHVECFLDKSLFVVNSSTREKTKIVDAVRKYLCLILSRNATSPLVPVYEVSLEIYWLMVSQLRNEFKREIPVFLDEIYFPVSDMKTSTAHQKRYLLDIVHRICSDPKALIELYLNYDCDPQMPNLCEKIMDYLARFSLTRIEVTPAQKISYNESAVRPLAAFYKGDIPSLSVNKLSSHPSDPDESLNFPVAYALKMVSINTIVSFLKSLSSWCEKSPKYNNNNNINTNGSSQDDDSVTINRERSYTTGSFRSINSASAIASQADLSVSNSSTSLAETEDLFQFETSKQRKTALLEGVRLFNYAPKKGIKYLIDHKFISSGEPKDIALFLLTNDSLDKAVIGEYLGEGDEKNIQIMHSFVDQMEFAEMSFLDALREFLQSFRLPGESQKIDRFMLKFAERYVNGNPTIFANADTVYVLAYSVIMLNTDQHSPQVKNKMTLDDFINNNRGIDDGKDLPYEFLSEIYSDIQNDEIILKSEQHAALITNEQPEISTGFFGGRDAVKEAYLKASKELSNKTEQVVKSLRDKSKGSKNELIFYSATNHTEHVRSIFDTLWMSILAGLTPPFKDYDDLKITKTLLEGIYLSIRISCLFDIAYARTSFIRALVQFANLNNLEELKEKNVVAIQTILDVAVTQNSLLKSSWKLVLTSISQIERLHLIAQGVSSDTVPDLLNAMLANRNSIDTIRAQQATTNGFFSFGKKQTISEQNFMHHLNQKLPAEIITKITTSGLDVAIDKVFSKSSEIEGDGIFDFIAALTEVAYEEIESSGQSEHPRMFSLQKMVDVCYYNMGRIRVQWSALWTVMGEKFNEFGCHSNTHIAFFAIDSLRQLSERFFDIEELSHFKFQKEFLKPFSYILVNNDNMAVKEMVLDCVQYMVQKKNTNIKSGWVSILDILTNAAKENNEKLVSKAYSYASLINKKEFQTIYKQDAYEPLVLCLTEFAKNEVFQKTSLQALQDMKKIVHYIAEINANNETENTLIQYWFPILFGFHDVIMTGDDLEVRSKALNIMFDSLVENGEHFEIELWDKICNELLFPIFGILSKHWGLSSSQDEISVWLSTTLIQALRNMIALFGYFFEKLNHLLEGYLNLLVSCICQENETISKIGISCLKELIVQNGKKFSSEHWEKINQAFKELFELTTATELFKADPLRNETSSVNGGTNDDNSSEDSDGLEDEEQGANGGEVNGNGISSVPSPNASVSRLDSIKEKSTIVIKCVLQLHMIQILSELFDTEEFYDVIPAENLMKLTQLLEYSYDFSRKFNIDYNLRVRLWNAGVIDKLPNLLKQETASSGVYISILFRLYCDNEKVDETVKSEITDKLIPLGVSILESYSAFDEVEQARNINSWKPVILEIIQAFSELDEEDFIKCCPVSYDLILKLFDKAVINDLRIAVKDFLERVGDVYITDDKPTKE